MNLITTIIHFIEKHNLLKSGSTVIVGLSGGPDSVFLLHFLQTQYGSTIKLIAAHLDHQWRPDSSNDVAFCKRLADQLHIPFIAKTITQLSASFKDVGSKEALGRAARQHFFQELCKEYNAQSVALGHHLQDQEETFFIRLIRGTTLTGLCSMRPQQSIYIRPLLETKKADILAYLHEHNIPYLTDPTNSSVDFLRNRIRMQVLPTLHAVDNRFDANFLRTLENLQEAEAALEQLTQEIWQTLTVEPNGINYKKLFTVSSFMQYRILMQWLINAQVSFTPAQSFLDEILRFLRNEQSEHTIHHEWKIVKKNNTVFIEKR